MAFLLQLLKKGKTNKKPLWLKQEHLTKKNPKTILYHTLKPFLSNRMSGAKYKTFVEEVKTSLSLMCHYQSVKLSFCACTDLCLLVSVYDNVITGVKTVLNKASFVERLCFVWEIWGKRLTAVPTY